MDSTVIVVGILVALAAAVVTLPARRERPAGLDARLDAATGKGADGGSVRSQCDVGGVGSVGGTDVGLMLTEVATLLRAGATPRRAWSRSLARTGLSEGVEPGDDGVPPALRPTWAFIADSQNRCIAVANIRSDACLQGAMLHSAWLAQYQAA